MGTVEQLKTSAGLPKVGDTVYLNSGSPALTVTAVHHEGTDALIDVAWITGGGHFQEGQFPAGCLCLSSDPGPFDSWYTGPRAA